MRFKIVRLNLLVGIQLAEPYFQLPMKLPEVAEKFYKALSPRHRMWLTDMQSAGGNTFGDVKLTINVDNGKGKIEITPSGLITDLRDLVQTEEDLKAVRDYLVTCEQTLVAAVRPSENAAVEVVQRDIRTHVWIECEGGTEVASRWLAERGNAGLRLAADAYPGMRRDYTLQVHVTDEKGSWRLGVGIQSSQVGIGHLYLVCEQQSYRKEEPLRPIDAQFDQAYSDIEGLLRQLGLEPARDNA
jgi:hypothetical protein